MTDENINNPINPDEGSNNDSNLISEAEEIKETASEVRPIEDTLIPAQVISGETGRYVYHWNTSMERAPAQPKKKQNGALTFAIITSVAFLIAITALLCVIFFFPEGSGGTATATYSYTELYEKCAPFTVSIETPAKSIGSGFFITESGRVLTNYHVVEGSKTVTVHTHGGKDYAGKVIASDKAADIAIVDITNEGNEKFPVATIADSTTVKTGESIIVIGTPEEIALAWTMTVGYVSCANREISNSELIQFDAAVNPGNSGGPIINMKGEVIGVVQSKASKVEYIYDANGNISGISERLSDGIGFAIPSNRALSVVNELVKNHGNGDHSTDGEEEQEEAKTPTVQLGITGVQVFDEYEYFYSEEALFNVKTEETTQKKYIEKNGQKEYLSDAQLQSENFFKADSDGIWVLESSASAGAYGKLQRGDILFSIDGVLIDRYQAYYFTGNLDLFTWVSQILLKYEANDTVDVEIMRNGTVINEKITLTKRATE